MAASVTVNVNVSDRGALAYLTSLDALIHRINSTPINVGGAANSINTVNTATNRLAVSAGNLAATFATMFAIKNVKEALSTMKEVDTQLTNIRKVTNESKKDLKSLGDTAYDTASKYGVAADKYLASAYEFAKAGKSNYAGLAELATKTMLVGDTTDEVASKFLLSADAAYKYNGNLEQLSMVVDKADFINNNYATSLGKIAQGLPIVASTASMANMSIDELMAALGTITATTQETGTKAATALRALILNITGQIGEVLEDEQGQFEITKGSVESMSDALKKYGSDAIKAAKATGDLIDPMEAVRSLSEAYANGDLSRSELFDILSTVGGKLRTNQLAALVENFGMFEQILSELGGAAGTADKEIEQMLDSWNAKTNILKNSWTDLISDIVETEAIKGFIDGLTAVIDGFDEMVKYFSQSDLEKAQESNKDTAKTYEELFGKNGTLSKEIERLEKNYSNLTEFDRKRLDYLQQQRTEMRSQRQEAEESLKTAERESVLRKKWVEQYDDNGEYLGMTRISEAQRRLESFREAYQEALKEDGSKNRQEISDNLNQLLDEYKDYYDLLEEMGGKRRKDVKEAADFYDLYNEALKQQEIAAANAADEIERLGETIEETVDYADDLTTAFDDNTTSIEAASAALSDYAEAMKTAKGTAASGYESAYKAFLEDWEAGMTDSTAINAVADMFLSPEMKSALGYNAKAMGEFLSGEFFQAVFAGGNAGANLANYLYDNLGSFPGLSEITKFSIDENGNLDFTYASVEKLASALNISLPLMQALLDAVDVYGEEIEMGWEGTQELANKLQDLGVQAGDSGMKLQDVVSGLHQIFSDASAAEISAYVSALGKEGFIEGFENIDLAELGAIIDSVLKGIEPAPTAEAQVTVDGEQTAEAVQEAAEEASPEVEVTTTVNDEASEVLNEIEDKDVTITMHGEDDGFVELKDEWHGVESKDETLEFVGEDNGLTSLANTWHGVQSKTVTLTVNVVQNGSIPQFAEGTKDAPGGVALVNEKGPELISDNGKAYIANGGKPAIVTLGKGAIVLTAEETRQAIGNISVNNGIPAYASGIPRASSAKGGGGGGGSSTKTKKEKESSSKEKDPWEELEKELKEDLKDFDEIAEWYHNQKRHEEEVQTYQEAIARINEARDKYREAGFEEASAELARLANEIFDYEEDIKKAYSHAIDDLEDEIDLIDEQIELAENQGDLEKSLQLQKVAQEKIAELIEAYRKAGYDDTSEQILKLANKGYDYTSDTDSTMKKLWSNLIDALNDMKESQDDANTLAEKHLAVEEAREALINAQGQRTVRIFNPITGQWEWIADAKTIADAEEKLASAEESLLKEQQSQELDSLKKLADSNGNLSDFTIGPGLASILGGANAEQMNAFATALGILTGGGKIAADTSSRSVFDSIDSHNSNVTQYTFNGVTIDASTAENTTLADLVRMISPLAITNNMPA